MFNHLQSAPLPLPEEIKKEDKNEKEEKNKTNKSTDDKSSKFNKNQINKSLFGIKSVKK